MKHKRIEGLSDATREAIAAARAEALAEAQDIAAKPEDKLSPEDLAIIEELGTVLDEYDAQLGEIDAADTAHAERVAAARAKIANSTPVDEETPADETDEEGAEDEEPEEPGDEVDEAASEKEKEPVAASGARKSGAVRKASSRAPEVVTDEKPVVKAVGKLVASTNIPGIVDGAELDMDGLVAAFIGRSRAFAGRKPGAGPDVFDRYGVVNIERPANEFTIDGRTSASEQMAIIDAVAKEARLSKGGKTGLIAAGGWCAPSETLYSFCELEEIDGLLSLPEATITHGGLNFTKGPDLTTLLADPDFGFTLTEAQLEAGTPEKVCFTVDCPPFEDHRLDAVGWCFQAPIPTASPSGWPELVRRYLNLAITAHQYRMNADSLNRLSTAIGTAVNFTELGSATADILDALSLNADVLRESLFLKTDATIEVVLPLWAPSAIRADLARRNGDMSYLFLTDAQIRSLFTARNLAPQFVRGYQTITTVGATAGQALPATLEAMLYPAGTYVLGVNDVISLDTVYDSASLKQNTYTAAFFEESRMLFNPCGTGRKVAVALTGDTRLLGITGANKLGETVVTP